MAVDYKDRWLVNIQHSIYAHLKARLDQVWPYGVIVPEWPEEDDKLKTPEEYEKLSESEKPNFVKLPAVSIQMRAPFGFQSVELGSRDEVVFTVVQIYLQELSRTRFQVFSEYIANVFKNKNISIFDYEKQYPNPTASVVGYLKTGKPMVIANKSIGIVNSALKWGGLITFNAEWDN